MSINKKIDYYWFYYKWYFLAVIAAVLILADYVSGKVHIREIDGQVAFVTEDYISEEVQNMVSSYLENMWKDINEDGTIQVAVHCYRYNGNTQTAVDPNEFMASAVGLAADMENRDSMIYFTDCPGLLLEADDELQELGRWKEIPALTGIHEEKLDRLIVLGWDTAVQDAFLDKSDKKVR